MPARYYLTLTDYGAAQVAQAHNTTSILLSELVLGDAYGVPYDPVEKKERVALVNQKATVPVQSVSINGPVTTVIATVPANIGGFNLHEIGLKDDTGQLVYIGNYHGAYKPVIAEGAGGDLTLVIDITSVSGKEALIEIDPTVVIANKKWVLDNLVRIPVFEQAINDLQQQQNIERDSRIYSDNLLNDKIDQANQVRFDVDKLLSDRIFELENAPVHIPVGVNQLRYDVGGIRTGGTVYTNPTNRIIEIQIAARIYHTQGPAKLLVNGEVEAMTFCDVGNGGYIVTMLIVRVPPFGTYELIGDNGFMYWGEIR
ncbi:hypothetical protein F909_00968 [Acinetobacter sp. ANC 3929]|uniref:phage tail protein n=1 Tax=Acinetobacter sp. ANC 3929 TaxID=1217707 RepID=UPI0002CF6F77|nr:phage tail protein [Acinetobacter sp. ANC 3929]ENW82697.1 hypothetical protein F909_00968 [Acinetobacter sp. ANC 3929]